MHKPYTGLQYSLFRAVFGLYLLVHFIALLPWSAETFSAVGMLPQAGDSPLIRAFPNVLGWLDTPLFVAVFVGSGAVASVFFLLGYGDRVAALWLWYVLACLYGRNPLTGNPSLPFVGWMLLFHVAAPPAPPGSLGGWRRPELAAAWHMPRSLYGAVWLLMALAYSYSGYTKLISPSWIDGTALWHVLHNPLARPLIFRDLLLAAPPIVLKGCTWGVLGLELGFAPLAGFRSLRLFLWLSMLSLHIGLVGLIDFADLSIGMIMLHLLTFDPNWLSTLSTNPSVNPRQRVSRLIGG